MLEDIAAGVQKKPVWILLAVVVVAILAYLQSKNSQSPSGVSFAGGGAARAIDPQAAAIEEAAINAGHSNIETLASLIGTENGNQSALFGSIHQTDAQLNASLAATEAARTTSLAETEANRTTSLAATEAGRATGLAQIAAALQASLTQTAASQEISDAQTAASVQVSQGNNSTAITAANISAQSAAQIAQINAQTEAARVAAEASAQRDSNQTTKDIARAADNTGIANGIIHTIGEIAGGLLSFFGF